MQGCFYTRVLLHRGTFHTGLLLHRRLHIQMLLPRVTLAYKTFMNRYFYTEMLRHTKTFIHRHAVTSTHRCLYVAVLLHRNAFTHRCFWTRFLFGLYTQKLLHTNSLTQRCCLDRNAFIQRRFWHSDIFAKRYFCKDTCAQRCLYTQVVLDQGDSRTGTSTWARLEKLIHSHLYVYAHMIFLLYREILLPTSAFTQGGAFTQRWVYAERWFHKGILLHTGTLTQRCFQHGDASTHRRFKTQKKFHRDDLPGQSFRRKRVCT